MEVSRRIEKCINNETLSLLPFFKWLAEILTASFALQNFTLVQPIFSHCGNQEIGQDGKVTECVKKYGEYYPVVPNYYDQCAFS